MWEVIKQKKFKLHIPFLFLLPSFINKTFFTEKSIFLKFFYKKGLNFKILTNKKVFFLTKKNTFINFRWNFIKNLFLVKKTKDFQKKFKSFKFKKTINNNKLFFVSAYWSLFSKTRFKSNSFNIVNGLNWNIFNLGFLNFKHAKFFSKKLI